MHAEVGIYIEKEIDRDRQTDRQTVYEREQEKGRVNKEIKRNRTEYNRERKGVR